MQRRLLLALAAAVLLNACQTPPPSSASQPPAASPVVQQDAIEVAMYPWVPRLQQMKDTLAALWSSRHPDVTLTFTAQDSWDGGYTMPPPPTADVFVFDALFLRQYRAQGVLVPIAAKQVEHLEDFLPYAIEPMKTGHAYDAIPLLGCTDVLFFWHDDQELRQATTFPRLMRALGQCPYTSATPPNADGLMMDLSGKTSNACKYLAATSALTKTWPVTQPYPPGQPLYAPALQQLRTLLERASYLDAAEPQAPYVQGAWFTSGHGRALIGFTETMSAMSPAALSRIDLRVLPMGDGSMPPLFYADVVGIRAKAQRTPRQTALAVELANLLASSEALVAATGPDASGVPQYLIPSRPSAFQTLGKQFPLYQRMFDMVTKAKPVLFTLDEHANAWLKAAGATIRSGVQAGFTCGCDFPAQGPIWGQLDAQSKCPVVCGAHGGWTGDWVTTVPGQSSSCGCFACDIPGRRDEFPARGRM